MDAVVGSQHLSLSSLMSLLVLHCASPSVSSCYTLLSDLKCGVASGFCPPTSEEQDTTNGAEFPSSPVARSLESRHPQD